MTTFRIHLARLAIALLVLADTAKLASATDFCVQTLSDLTTGLNLATLVELPDNDVTLKLVAQTYVWNVSDNASRTYVSKNRLRLLGGYNSDCTTRTINPDNTVIRLTGSTGIGFETSGDEEIIEGITIQHASNLSFGSPISCTNIGKTLRVERSKLLALNAGGSRVMSLNCHNLLMQNTLIVGGHATYLQSFADDGATSAKLVNNTIVSGFGGIALYRSASADPFTASLYNNVLWGNGSDLDLDNGSSPVTVFAYHNTWAGTGVSLSANIGNSTANPQLTASYRLGEPASPAINSGFNSVAGGLPGTDLAGGPRLVGSAVDRGAYESSVDNSAPLQVSVSSTADSGAGTLRQAILTANATPGLNILTFNVGTCPKFITLNSPLPDITDSLWIAGYSAAGASANTLTYGNNAAYCVRVIDNSGVARAFRVPSGAPSTTQLILQGLAIGGFDDALVLDGGSNHVIGGNHFGPGLTSFLDIPANNYNIRVGGTANNVLIGGDAVAARNTISGATIAGIRIAGSGLGNQIINNYIGSGRDGAGGPFGDPGNSHGIELLSDYALARDNIIGLSITGVLITGEGNQLESNRIGLKALSFCLFPPCAPDYDALPNTGGVTLASGATNNLFNDNRIAKNLQHGVAMSSTAGKGNWLVANSIYANGTLGLDLLDPNGPDTNDLDVAVNFTGPNGHLNYPVLGSALGGAHSGRIAGSLASHNGNFRIEFFASSQCDASSYGEGERFLGASTVTVSGATTVPPSNGTINIDAAIASDYPLGGKFITATASDQNGNTSEFSACIPYQCDSIFANGFDDASSDSCASP